MRAALLALSLAAAGPAWAWLGAVTLNVPDPNTGKGADDAFVFVRETGRIGRFHGSTTVCIRADLAAVTAGKARIDLPLPSINPAIGDRTVEAFAYRPGHCVARALAQDGHTVKLEAAVQHPHERLLYLEDLALTFICEGRWSDGSDAVVAKLTGAIEGELRPLERDAFSRRSAQRVRERLQLARKTSVDVPAAMQGALPHQATFSRDFTFAPPNHTIAWDRKHEMMIVAQPVLAPQVIAVSPPQGNRPGQAVGVVGAQVPSSRPAAAPLAIHCRHGKVSACDLDQRNESGETALGEAVRSLEVEQVKLLLAAGADPGVPIVPSGPLPLEALLKRALQAPPESRDAQGAREIFPLLVSHPRSTLPPRLKSQLALDPRQWTEVRNHPGLPLLVQYRNALSAVPVDDAAKRGCPTLAYTSWNERSSRLLLRLDPNPN